MGNNSLVMFFKHLIDSCVHFIIKVSLIGSEYCRGVPFRTVEGYFQCCEVKPLVIWRMFRNLEDIEHCGGINSNLVDVQYCG